MYSVRNVYMYNVRVHVHVHFIACEVVLCTCTLLFAEMTVMNLFSH